MKITDKNNIPNHKKMLEELFSHKILIGIFGESGSDILMIANVNEYGCKIQVTEKMRNYLHAIGLHLKKDTTTINIPERSFVRSGWDSRRKKIEDTSIKLLKKVLLMQITPIEYFNLLGEYTRGQLVEYMTRDVQSPPNHPFTIAQKGSSNPLIDTGRLKDSIAYKVVKA